MRTFVAIELPEHVRRQLEAEQRRLGRMLQEAHLTQLVRWTAGQNLHLTLRFLGETGVAQQDAVAHGLAALARTEPPFALAPHQLGCFPNWHRPNIIWIDFTGATEALGRLQRHVEQTARSAGFPAEERPFTPHLTLGRVRREIDAHARQQLGEVLQRAQAAHAGASDNGAFPIAAVAFIQSELRPDGPHYTTLADYSLNG